MAVVWDRASAGQDATRRPAASLAGNADSGGTNKPSALGPRAVPSPDPVADSTFAVRLYDAECAQSSMRPSNPDFLDCRSMCSGLHCADGAFQRGAPRQYRVGLARMGVSHCRNTRGHRPWLLPGDVHLLALDQANLQQAQWSAIQARRPRGNSCRAVTRHERRSKRHHERSRRLGCCMAGSWTRA